MTPEAGEAGVWVIRHASTAWSGVRFCGRSDPPLDDAGRRAAVELVRGLARDVPPGVTVVTSPLRRARDTADVIAHVLGSDVRLDPAWQEADMGAIDGLTWDEVAARMPAVANALLRGEEVDWPGGERHEAFVARVRGAWEAVRSAPGPTVIVTHGGPLRVVLASLGREAGHVPPGTVVRVPCP